MIRTIYGVLLLFCSSVLAGVRCPKEQLSFAKNPDGSCPSGSYDFFGICCLNPDYSIYFKCPYGENPLGQATGPDSRTCTYPGSTSVQNYCCNAYKLMMMKCPGGEDNMGWNIDGTCSYQGYTLIRDMCCPETRSEPDLDPCPYGGLVSGNTDRGLCSDTVVTYGNYCCRYPETPAFWCPLNDEAIGPFHDQYCPAGYLYERDGLCCKDPNSAVSSTSSGGSSCPSQHIVEPAIPGVDCPAGSTKTDDGNCCDPTRIMPNCGTNNAHSLGPCSAGSCSQLGYGCSATSHLCCPTVNVTDTSKFIGPAIGGMCPTGTTAIYGMTFDSTNIGYCFVVY